MSENVLTESVDLRIRRSRKLLMEALMRLMRHKPLQKISVRDITEEAMVNRSTFYAHFVDKYDLFKAAIGQRMRHELATELGDSTGFNQTNLRTLILVGGKLMGRISNDCRRINKGETPRDELLPLLMTEMQTSIHEVISSWANNMNISKTEANGLAIFTTGAVFGAVSLWGQQSENTQSIEELADQIMPLVINGIKSYTD